MYRSKIKPFISKVNFQLGKNPKIEKTPDWQKFVSAPYKAVVTITADFELAWAWRYSKGSRSNALFAVEKAKIERSNIPVILKLCDRYIIPVTWATVGHLFLESCNKINGRAHPEIPNVKPYKGKFWDFKGKDWFEYDPFTDYKTNPEWYAPDLVQMILNRKVKHEIGCHTFSHIDCRDEVCPPDLFEAEIGLSVKYAEKYGIKKMASFVHPGHQIGNLAKLKELGFTSFQTDPGNILGYPVKHENGLWELKRTYEFVYRPEWSLKYHVFRYKKIIDRAIRHHGLCNFWFHPSVNSKFIESIMPEIFQYLNEKRDEVYITTVGNYIDWLEG